MQQVGDAAQRLEAAAIGKLSIRVGIDKGLAAQRHHVGGARQAVVHPAQGRSWHRQLAGQVADAVGALLGRRLARLAIAVQGDGAAARPVGAEAPLLELDEQLVVEQPPPDRDGLARQVGIDVVESAIDPDARISRYAAALGFAREGAEAFPGTHLPQALAGQVARPVLDAAMRLSAVRLGVVAVDIA